MSNVVQFRRRPSYAVSVANLPYLVEARSRLQSLCDQYIANNCVQSGPWFLMGGPRAVANGLTLKILSKQ